MYMYFASEPISLSHNRTQTRVSHLDQAYFTTSQSLRWPTFEASKRSIYPLSAQLYRSCTTSLRISFTTFPRSIIAQLRNSREVAIYRMQIDCHAHRSPRPHAQYHQYARVASLHLFAPLSPACQHYVGVIPRRSSSARSCSVGAAMSSSKVISSSISTQSKTSGILV